jgi:putative flippase GtrA
MAGKGGQELGRQGCALDNFSERMLDRLLLRVFRSRIRVVAFWRMVRYGIIGIGATVVYGLTALLFHYVAGIPAVAASFMAYCCAAFLSYFGHRIFTFQDNGKIGRSAPRFIGVNLLGNLVAIGIPWIVSDLLRFPAALSIGLVCIVVPAMSYVLLNFFVFDNARPKSQQPV